VQLGNNIFPCYNLVLVYVGPRILNSKTIYKYHKSACLIEMCLAEFFFFFQFCEASGLGNNHKRTLAKFGYRSEGKITIFETLHFLLPYIGDMQELMV
jgi:hypothetical protein